MATTRIGRPPGSGPLISPECEVAYRSEKLSWLAWNGQLAPCSTLCLVSSAPLNTDFTGPPLDS